MQGGEEHLAARAVAQSAETVHEGGVLGGEAGLVALPGGQPVHLYSTVQYRGGTVGDLRDGRVAVQVAVHDGEAGAVHRNLVLQQRPVSAHRAVCIAQNIGE